MDRMLDLESPSIFAGRQERCDDTLHSKHFVPKTTDGLFRFAQTRHRTSPLDVGFLASVRVLASLFPRADSLIRNSNCLQTRRARRSIASPDHRHGSREAAAHVEREKSFRALDLLRASLFGELLIRFKNLSNTSRSDGVTIRNQAAARVHRNLKRPFEFFRANLRQRSRSAFHKLDTFTRLGEPENFVGDNFGNRKT